MRRIILFVVAIVVVSIGLIKVFGDDAKSREEIAEQNKKETRESFLALAEASHDINGTAHVEWTRGHVSVSVSCLGSLMEWKAYVKERGNDYMSNIGDGYAIWERSGVFVGYSRHPTINPPTRERVPNNPEAVAQQVIAAANAKADEWNKNFDLEEKIREEIEKRVPTPK